jgi:hypothetical protein
MGYERALDERQTLARWWRTPEALAGAITVGKTVYSDGGNDFGLSGERYGQVVAGNIRRVLDTSDAFFVEPDICALVAGASESLPDTTLRQEDVPTQLGWLYFDRPLRIPVDAQGQTDLRAMDPADDLTEVPLAAIAWDRYDQGIILFFFADLRYRNRLPGLCIIWVCSMAFGQTWRRWEDQPDSSFNLMLRALLTFFRFSAQHILTTTARQVGRAAQRRLARENPVVPPVHLVILRRKAYRAINEETGRTVEWSCQWLVRGHWRQQFFPSDGSNRPIWIAPYLKGPEGKPIRIASETVYDVAR